MYDKQPQSYAEMFEMAMQELKKQTDIYFEMKKKEFDKYVDRKVQEKSNETN